MFRSRDFSSDSGFKTRVETQRCEHCLPENRNPFEPVTLCAQSSRLSLFNRRVALCEIIALGLRREPADTHNGAKSAVIDGGREIYRDRARTHLYQRGELQLGRLKKALLWEISLWEALRIEIRDEKGLRDRRSESLAKRLAAELLEMRF